MLKRDKQHRKLNNKGMTLVEVILTVTILVLVSGFILSAFISSMRAANKSREVHRATTVAQNIMEGINLKTAQELAFQFSYPKILDDTGAWVDNFNVYPSTMFQYSTANSVGELMEWTDPTGVPTLEVADKEYTLLEYKALTAPYDIEKTKSAYLGDLASRNYEFLEDAEGRYIYYMRNLKNDGAYYNARITLDASPYRTGGSSGIDINSEKLISVPTIDSAYDAVEVMKENLDSEAIHELESRAEYAGETIELGNLHRIITIDISDALMAGPSGLHRTKIDVTYDYYFEKQNGTPSDPYEANKTVAFDNEGNEDVKQLRNIYLYYYPMYKEGTNTDTIIVNNPNNVDVDLFIIKQENNDLTQQQMKINEMAYRVYFNVNEPTTSVDGNSHITLHTNLNENLMSVYDSTLSPISQVQYRRNSGTVSQDMYRVTDIKNKQAKDRIFNVTVELFKSEKANDLANFSADVPANWFKAENHLVTMTSSISQ